MHRENDILQNACFHVLHFAYISDMRGISAARVLIFLFLAGNSQQARKAADYPL